MKQIEKEPMRNNKMSHIVANVIFALALVITVTYFILTLFESKDAPNQLSMILGTFFIAIFSVFFIFTAMMTEKKGKRYAVIAALCLTCYSSFQILETTNLFKLPEQNIVNNFTGKVFTEAVTWAQSNHIKLEQVYEYSDTVEAYHIIYQDIDPGTLVKKVDTMTITISEGPNLEKEVLIPSMLGWTAEEVLAFIQKNHLSNVNVEFIVSDSPKDTVINQEGSGELKRNSLIKLTFSIGSEEDIVPITIPDLTNKSLFEATFWLKQHGFQFELAYDYSDKINKNYVISQSSKKDIAMDPKTEKITLTISKGSKIIVPDLTKMNMEQITEWISKNHLKIEFTDRYDDSIKTGLPIEISVQKDEVIEEGTLIKVVLSKGPLKMEKFTSASDFKNWANQYNIPFTESFEFNDQYEIGQIISFSHKEGQTIKNNETVSIVISQGKAVTVPKFIGKSKSKISNECKSLGIVCNFVYGSYSETIEKDIATNQSKGEGGKIVAGTSISITLSRGIQQKVTVPNFVGKTRSAIQSECNNLGLSCNFTTESYFSEIPKDQATRQSVGSGSRVVPGTNISITLSKGPARSYSIIIQPTWMAANNPEKTKATLKEKLEANCPGVNFNFQMRSVNTGAGLIHPDSPIKIGQNTFVEGQSYTIIIGS